jgi:hypothetical protein
MLAWALDSGGSGTGSLPGFLDAVWREAAVRGELLELLAALDAASATRAAPSPLGPEALLTLHARYTRRRWSPRSGSPTA